MSAVCPDVDRENSPIGSGLREDARLAAHVLIDSISALDSRDAGCTTAADLAFQRINDIVVVTTHIDRSTAEVTIDMSALLGGCVIPMTWLIGQLAGAVDKSETEVTIHADPDVKHSAVIDLMDQVGSFGFQVGIKTIPEGDPERRDLTNP